MTKFQETFGEPKDFAVLQERLLQKFPKNRHANYAPFYSFPGNNKIGGHLHPSQEQYFQGFGFFTDFQKGPHEYIHLFIALG